MELPKFRSEVFRSGIRTQPGQSGRQSKPTILTHYSATAPPYSHFNNDFCHRMLHSLLLDVAGIGLANIFICLYIQYCNFLAAIIYCGQPRSILVVKLNGKVFNTVVSPAMHLERRRGQQLKDKKQASGRMRYECCGG